MKLARQILLIVSKKKTDFTENTKNFTKKTSK